MIVLLAMVVFGVITAGELKEFDMFLTPLVALVRGPPPITAPGTVPDSGTRADTAEHKEQVTSTRTRCIPIGRHSSDSHRQLARPLVSVVMLGVLVP